MKIHSKRVGNSVAQLWSTFLTSENITEESFDAILVFAEQVLTTKGAGSQVATDAGEKYTRFECSLPYSPLV